MTLVSEMRRYVNLVESADFDPEYVEFLQQLVGFVIDGSGRNLEPRTTELFRKYADILHAPVYRGISLDSWDQMDAGFDFRNSEILKTDHFLSASLEKSVAKGKYIGTGKVRILFGIVTNANTDAIIPEDYKDDIFALTNFENLNDEENIVDSDDFHAFLSYLEEDEVLIVGPAEFKVVKKVLQEKTADFEYWIVQLEQAR